MGTMETRGSSLTVTSVLLSSALLSPSPLRSSAVIGDNIQVLPCAPDFVLLLTECPQAPASVGHQAIFYNVVSPKDVQVPGPNRV